MQDGTWSETAVVELDMRCTDEPFVAFQLPSAPEGVGDSQVWAYKQLLTYMVGIGAVKYDSPANGDYEAIRESWDDAGAKYAKTVLMIRELSINPHKGGQYAGPRGDSRYFFIFQTLPFGDFGGSLIVHDLNSGGHGVVLTDLPWDWIRGAFVTNLGKEILDPTVTP
jgi:hypothetical protein